MVTTDSIVAAIFRFPNLCFDFINISVQIIKSKSTNAAIIKPTITAGNIFSFNNNTAQISSRTPVTAQRIPRPIFPFLSKLKTPITNKNAPYYTTNKTHLQT